MLEQQAMCETMFPITALDRGNKVHDGGTEKRSYINSDFGYFRWVSETPKIIASSPLF